MSTGVRIVKRRVKEPRNAAIAEMRHRIANKGNSYQNIERLRTSRPISLRMLAEQQQIHLTVEELMIVANDVLRTEGNTSLDDRFAPSA
jgi:hypothetical protein